VNPPSPPRTPADLLAGHPPALAIFRRIRSIVEQLGPVEVRTTTSQIAFRRRRGFAYVWRPGQYLAHPDAPVVLSIALGRRDRSPRWKEVVHPARDQWMHHLEVHTIDDLDEQVADWLREAADRAGGAHDPSPAGGAST